MSCELFIKQTSPVHRLDGRVKILAGLLFSVVTATLSSPLPALAALATGAALVLAARLPLNVVARRLAVVNLFLALLWITLPFSTPGEPLLALGPLTLTKSGLMLSVLVTLKSNAIILALMALISTMEVHALGRGLRALGLSEKLTQVLLFTHRYIPVIGREYSKLSTAAKMRAFSPGTNMHTYRTCAHMTGMLLVRSWDRAVRVRQAMLCRGFDGGFHTLAVHSMRGKDKAFLALAILYCAALAATNLISR